MRVVQQHFCALATSAKWQAWLYNHDKNHYSDFIERLRHTKGCQENRELMLQTLVRLKTESGSYDKLLEFLKVEYPFVLDGPVSTNVTNCFRDFTPGLLTYPRRVILAADQADTQKRIDEFLANKLAGDSMVVGNTIYIEYLEQSDAPIQSQIPAKNWITTNCKRLVDK